MYFIKKHDLSHNVLKNYQMELMIFTHTHTPSCSPILSLQWIAPPPTTISSRSSKLWDPQEVARSQNPAGRSAGYRATAPTREAPPGWLCVAVQRQAVVTSLTALLRPLGQMSTPRQ